MNRSHWAAGQTVKMLEKYCLKSCLTGLARREERFGDLDIAEIIVIPRSGLSDIMSSVNDTNSFICRGISDLGIPYIDIRAFGTRVSIYLSAAKSFGSDLFFTTGSEEYLKLVMLEIKNRGWAYDSIRRSFSLSGGEWMQFSSESKTFKVLGISLFNPARRNIENEDVRLYYSGVLNRLRKVRSDG